VLNEKGPSTTLTFPHRIALNNPVIKKLIIYTLNNKFVQSIYSRRIALNLKIHFGLDFGIHCDRQDKRNRQARDRDCTLLTI